MVVIVTSSFLIYLAVQLTLVNSAWSGNRDGCPSDWNVEIFGDKCYIFHYGLVRSYYNAESFCEWSGGTLANPKTEEINSFLVQKMDVYRMDSTWIGLEQIQSSTYYNAYENSDFRWIDGSSVQYSNFHPHSTPSIYYMYTQDFTHVYMNADGYWHEYSRSNSFSLFTRYTSSSKHFICEVPRDMTLVTKSVDDPKADDTNGGDIPEVDDGSETQKDDKAIDEVGEKTQGVPSDAQEKSGSDENDSQNTDNEKEIKDLAKPREDDTDLNNPEREDSTDQEKEDSDSNEPETEDPDLNDPENEDHDLNKPEKEDPGSNDPQKEDSDSNEPETEDPDSNDPETEDPDSHESVKNDLDSDSDDNKETKYDKDGQVHRCHFECHLDCGMTGYLKDSVTGCAICECDEA